MQFENSEVLPLGSVAVAVSTFPAGTPTANIALMLALQLLSVVTVVEPRKVWPSPRPEGSQIELE